jgi:hypothetical protein
MFFSLTHLLAGSVRAGECCLGTLPSPDSSMAVVPFTSPPILDSESGEPENKME